MSSVRSLDGRSPVARTDDAEDATSFAAGTDPVRASPGAPALRHLAVIPDGNRRWAKARGLASLEGHRRGCERTLEWLDRCRTETGIEVVTLWTTSVDNLRRPRAEVEPGLPVIAAFMGHVASFEDQVHR
ncbi:undecaprenyl diphosphate synthase family protein [Streptomyces sp. NPDC057798]|uniref:undecaprenyl diphosphate synthase family protein n=1 Tax=Streptomyces sp. NPDC057798 TaxID=3346252 RepID=UPI0036CDE89D